MALRAVLDFRTVSKRLSSRAGDAAKRPSPRSARRRRRGHRRELHEAAEAREGEARASCSPPRERPACACEAARLREPARPCVLPRSAALPRVQSWLQHAFSVRAFPVIAHFFPSDALRPRSRGQRVRLVYSYCHRRSGLYSTRWSRLFLALVAAALSCVVCFAGVFGDFTSVSLPGAGRSQLLWPGSARTPTAA